ncbi:hypothetical protein [Candidatus Cardinium hertigii]|nr:hypothetical protein [Candidatus Cardinium hertigii]
MALASSSTTDLFENKEKINDLELMQLVNENNRCWCWSGQPNIGICIYLDKLHRKYVSTLQLQNLLVRLVAYLCKAPCSELTVHCSSENPSGEYLDAIFTALKGTAVHSLKLEGADLGAVQAELLNTAFSKLKDTKIEKLELQDNHLANNVVHLLSALVNNKTLRELDLSGNNLGRVQAELLDTAFSKLKDTKIEKLELFGNHIADNIVPLLSALKNNTAIRCLHLDGNNLDAVALPTLRTAFSSLQHTAVDSLNFCTYGFSSWDLESMKELLATLSDTKIRKVSCWGPKGSRNLVDWFNSEIAYPHDTLYHENGLQRACIRTMMQNNLDLNKARSNIQVEIKIKEYNSDELGLIIYNSHISPVIRRRGYCLIPDGGGLIG